MPLNVLPSITKPPVAGSRRAEMEVAQPPVPSPVAPLGGEHDEVEGVRTLDLEPARAAPSRLVASAERLHHHALVPVGERVLEEALRLGRIARSRSSGRGSAPARAHRAARAARMRGGRAGRRRRRGGSRRRTVRAARSPASRRARRSSRSGPSSPGTGADGRPVAARSPRRRAPPRSAAAAGRPRRPPARGR